MTEHLATPVACQGAEANAADPSGSSRRSPGPGRSSGCQGADDIGEAHGRDPPIAHRERSRWSTCPTYTHPAYVSCDCHGE